MGLPAEQPAAVYAMHHPEHAAVKIGACLEPRQRRIAPHERRGWRLLAEFAAPTARDAETIERMVLDALTTRVWIAGGWGARDADGLPWHGTIAGCRHCGKPPAIPHLRTLKGGFLSREQMPQGGWSETFDARYVSPDRARLAVYFAEAAQRAAHYPDRADGLDPFEARRMAVSRAVCAERWARPVR